MNDVRIIQASIVRWNRLLVATRLVNGEQKYYLIRNFDQIKDKIKEGDIIHGDLIKQNQMRKNNYGASNASFFVRFVNDIHVDGKIKCR